MVYKIQFEDGIIIYNDEVPLINIIHSDPEVCDAVVDYLKKNLTSFLETYIHVE